MLNHTHCLNCPHPHPIPVALILPIIEVVDIFTFYSSLFTEKYILFICICRKKHFRLLSQPPFSFLFCAKTKKLCWQKNPLANDVKKHVGFIFSPAGELHTVFRRSDSCTKKGIFKFATKCDIACDKMRQNAISMRQNAISHFVAFCCMQYLCTLMLRNSTPNLS